jgi:hypothetical protein
VRDPASRAQGSGLRTGHLDRELERDAEENPAMREKCKDSISRVLPVRDPVRGTNRRKLVNLVKIWVKAPCESMFSSAIEARISSNSATTKVSVVSPRAWRRASAARPSSSRPTLMSHRGDSGKTQIRQASGIAGTIWRANGKRHWKTEPLLWTSRP